MFESDEILSTKSYDEQVTIEHAGEVYVGQLQFNPEIKKLIIRADVSKDRAFNLPYELDKLICEDLFGRKYIISNLDSNGSSWTFINSSQSHCYHVYTFESLFKFFGFEEPEIKSIEIHSDQLKSWAMYSTTQQNIMLNINHPNINLTEFSFDIHDIGTFSLCYDYKSVSEHGQFYKGVSFLPVLRLSLDTPCDYVKALEYTNSIIVLMAFLHGGEFRAHKVCVSDTSHSKGYFYINSLGLPTVNYSFFPQSINQHPLNGLDVPPLKAEVFSAYFSLVEKGSSIWKNYIRYKKIVSTEERFLGFFRLLEKLTFQEEHYIDKFILDNYLSEKKDLIKSELGISAKVCNPLLKAVKYGNKKKLNTESCIRKFADKITNYDDISCKFNRKEDIEKLVTLRNNITHANAINLQEYEIECLTKFTEMLLVFAMFVELGVAMDDVSKVIDRLSGMHLIKSMENYINIDNSNDKTVK